MALIIVAGIKGTTHAVTPAKKELPVTAPNMIAPQKRLRQVPKIREIIENPFHLERSSMPSPMM